MRNKRLNKKDFTLIEVIATVAILAILSVVAGISVNKIIQNAKEEHYHNAESNMEMAGQSYVQQNRSELPKTIGQKTEISLKQLEEKRYIKTIKDYSGAKCDSNKSYVQIFKYSQNDYSYRAYLDCGAAYTSADSIKKDSPTIKSEILGKSGDQQPKLKIEIEDENKLISWSYQIFRYGKEVKNSGSVALPNYDTKLNKTIDLKEYTPSDLKIIITATNIYGFTTTKTIGGDGSNELNFEDKTSPECIIAAGDRESVVKPWSNTPPTVKITVGCKDNGSGCEREEYSETFKTSTKIGIIKIKDQAGNTKDCKVSVYLDVTPPTKLALTITGDSTLTVVIKSTDAHSGMSHFEYRTLGTQDAFTMFPETNKEQITITTDIPLEIRAVDKSGNISSSAVTRHCNISGGTLTDDPSRGYICVKSTIMVSSTCPEECSGTCFNNVPCSGGWQSDTGWAGSGTYCSIPYDCTYPCSQPCMVTGCPSGFTLDDSRCIKTADGM